VDSLHQSRRDDCEAEATSALSFPKRQFRLSGECLHALYSLRLCGVISQFLVSDFMYSLEQGLQYLGKRS
jgi:hypothetical protein